MIGMVRGSVVLRNDPYILIDTGGVGYKVLVARDVLNKISGLGSEVVVFTYTHVREDMLELYGFSKAEDLRLFELLISVSGIGPKTAVGMFSLYSSGDIIGAIKNGNVETFTAVPRLGRKNAQKIIIELKNKVGGGKDLDLTSDDSSENSDVIMALKTFGYSDQEAAVALQEIDSALPTEKKIKLALRQLGK